VSHPIKSYLLYLRPKSFLPTFIFVLTGYVLGPFSGRGAPQFISDLAFMALVYSVLIWGGANAFNADQDADTGPMNLLPNPPARPPRLGAFGIAMMAIGVALSIAKGHLVFALSACGMLASVYYSWVNPWWRRGKEIPGIDILINAGGCGLGSVLAGYAFNTGTLSSSAWLVGVAFTVAIFGGLPTSQIFQMEAAGGRDHINDYATRMGARFVLRSGAFLFLLHIVLLASVSLRENPVWRLGPSLLLLAWGFLVVAAAIHSWLWANAPFHQPYLRMLRQLSLMMASQVCWIGAQIWNRYSE